MASTSATNLHNSGGNVPKSRFQTTVCLEDWWLVKAENDLQGTRLAVAGHTIGGKQPMRFFSCLPILKRFDVFTLETTDGICVIVKGFINKARSTENGFPSDVCNHFIFGFPPYWKEYAEKCMVKESPSVRSDPPHARSCGNDLGSEDPRDAKNTQRNKQTKSSAFPFLQKSETVTINSEKSQKMTFSASGGKEAFGFSIFEHPTTQDMPVKCLKNTMKSLTSSTFGGQIDIPSLTNKVVDSQIHESGGSLSACHLYTRSRNRFTDDSLRKVKLDKKGSTKANSNCYVNSLEVTVNDSMGRVETRSLSRLKKKPKNDETSAAVSGGKKILSYYVSSSMDSDKVELACADIELGSENNLHFEVTGHGGSTDKMTSSEIEVGSSIDKFEKIPETPNQGKNLKRVRTGVAMQKENKAKRTLSSLALAENEKQTGGADKHSISDHAKAPNVSAARKLVYETPVKEKEKVSINSPESLSFKRSRSGRLLMPPLEFWRNQMAVYDGDRTVTGIEEGIHFGQPGKGSKSTPVRRRRRAV